MNQVQIHESLNSFINGDSLKITSKLFYPLLDKNKNGLDSRHYASFLSKQYTNFYSSIKKTRRDKITIQTKSFETWLKKETGKHINTVKLLKKRIISLYPYIEGFYLHGSISTHDYIENWSDLDTVIIPKKEIIIDEKLLLEFRKKVLGLRSLLYSFDPFQHHGFFIITKEELNNYPEIFLPIDAFNYATCLYGNKKVTFNVIKTKESFEKINLYFEKQRKKLHPYDLKGFYHMALLLPSIYLHIKGKNVYKKFSFELIKKDFTKEELSVLDKISEIRRNWNYPPRFANFYTKSPFLLFFLNYIFRKKVKLTLAEEVKSLSNTMYEKLKKGGFL